jgi:hypothetical protein
LFITRSISCLADPRTEFDFSFFNFVTRYLCAGSGHYNRHKYTPFFGGVKKHRLLVVDKCVDQWIGGIYFFAAAFLAVAAFFGAALGAAAFFGAALAAFLAGLFGAAPTFLAAGFLTTLGAAFGEAFALGAAALALGVALAAAAGFAASVTMSGCQSVRSVGIG